MVEILSHAGQQSLEPRAHTLRGEAQVRADLARAHAQHVAQAQQLALGGVEPGQGIVQIQPVHLAGRVGRSWSRACPQLPDHANPLSSKLLARLVRRHAEQPRT